MPKAFTPKVPRSFGRIERQLLTPAQLADLFTNPKYLYKGQRDHGKNLKKRAHVRGALIGNSQQFAGAYCEELRSYVNLDGYHRAFAVKEGLAFFLPGHDIELSVFRVKTVQELDNLFDQYNSAVAAKKSGCYFDSGLRDAGLLHVVNSNWLFHKGKAMAVQMAADIKGTTQTRKAVLAVKDGILFCDRLNLPVTSHVFTGVKGALIAIAQHAKDKRLAETFIRNVCALSYEPSKPTSAELVVMNYRDKLMTNAFGGKTGANPNAAAFAYALGAFTEFVVRSKGKTMPVESSLTLAEFIRKMEALASAKA